VRRGKPRPAFPSLGGSGRLEIARLKRQAIEKRLHLRNIGAKERAKNDE
jgi:hypothetical protein